MAPSGPTEVEVPLGRRVMVLGDLLLTPEPTQSSSALTADVATTLSRWEGPGTVIVCGNLFAAPSAGALTASTVRAALDAHGRLAEAVRRFSSGPERRLLVVPGWRDPETGSDPAVVTELYRLGAEVAGSVLLRLATASGQRTVMVVAGRPAPAPGVGVAGAAPAYGTALETLRDLRWLAGADQLEDRSATGRFVTSRLLYRRLGRFLWVPPVLAAAVAVALHLGAGRLVATLGAVALCETALAIAVALASRRAWRANGGGPLSAPWRTAAGDGSAQGSVGVVLDGRDAFDHARRLVHEGVSGVVVGGGLRAELTHLGTGFFACPGGTTEVVREHPGRFGLPPVFLHHRRIGWVEFETGADLHARLLLGDADLPGCTPVERLASGRRKVAFRKPAAGLLPEQVASWPTGTSWPALPGVAADRLRARRVRRVAAGAILSAGLFDLLTAVSPPAASHLQLVREYLTLGLAQAAGALVALAGIALVMLARGVLRGQRRAWTVSVALLSATSALHVLHGGDAGGVLLTLVVLAMLLAERHRFAAAADRASARSAVLLLGAGGAVPVAAATLAVELTNRAPGRHLPHWPAVLAAVGGRLVGFQSLPLPDGVSDWVSPSLLTVGIAVALVALSLLTRPVVDRRLSSRGRRRTRGEGAGATASRRVAENRARDIVRRHGTGSLDYFALRSDKQWFFHRDSLVAYAVYGGVCLVSPDPIGPGGERRQVWAAWRRYCDRQGWAVAVLAAAEEWLPVYRDSGMRHVYLGDEAVVDVQRFSLHGGSMKGLRQAVGRVQRHGYTARILDPSGVGAEAARAIDELAGRNRRGDAERGFSMTLGRLFDRRDTGLLLTVVDDPAGRPVAMCQFVPSDGIGGYSLDMMRRDPGDHPNGLLDFALCATIEHLRRQGARGLSLNFATMRATLAGDDGDGLPQRVERWALRRISSLFAIESLWRFNAKYRPRWLPRYVVFDGPEVLAPTVVSILRAESLSELPLLGRFLVPPRQPTGAGSA